MFFLAERPAVIAPENDPRVIGMWPVVEARYNFTHQGIDTMFGVLGDGNLFIAESMMRNHGLHYVAATHEVSFLLFASYVVDGLRGQLPPANGVRPGGAQVERYTLGGLVEPGVVSLLVRRGSGGGPN